MKMKKPRYYIPLKIHPGSISIGGMESKLELPPRCKGLLFAFETKKAARDFYGRKCKLATVEEE